MKSIIDEYEKLSADDYNDATSTSIMTIPSLYSTASALIAVETFTSSHFHKRNGFDNTNSQKKQLMDSFPMMKKAHKDSFYASMRPALILAQVFAVMPVSGITGLNHGNIRFRWRHWKIVYTILTISCVFFFLWSCVAKMYREGFSFDGSAPSVFYASSFAGNILFLLLARKWSSFNNRIANVEMILSRYGYPHNQSLYFLVISTLFCSVAFVEHFFSRFVGAMEVIACRKFNETDHDLTTNYFKTQFIQIFEVIDYHLFLCPIFLFISFSATFCWNFIDLFLGLISLSLSAKLKQINRALLESRGQVRPTAFWRRIREEFNAVSVLVKDVDVDVQKLMLLSLGSNLFFICLQLLKSLKKREHIYHTIYFFWSFGFLIFRTLFVTMCASTIYDESREGRIVLYSVPHGSFCAEVRRLLLQLSGDELALTGCKFFSVTRGLILTIAGTVVTYEIVLVQFKSGNGEEESRMSHCEPLPQSLFT